MPPVRPRRRAPGCSARWTSSGTHARARTSATSWTAGSKSSMSNRRLAADTCSWSRSTSDPCWAVSRSPASTRNCWRRSTRDCASTATTATAGGSSSTARPGRMNATQDATACLPRTVSLQRSPGPLDPQRHVRQSGPLEVDRPQPRASGGQAGTPPSGSAAAERRRRFPNRHGSVARPGLGTFVWCAMTLGARRGELCALRWRNVDLANNVVTLRHAIAVGPDRQLVERSTRTHQQRRVVLDDETVQVLADHRRLWQERVRALGVELSPTRSCSRPPRTEVPPVAGHHDAEVRPARQAPRHRQPPARPAALLRDRAHRRG